MPSSTAALCIYVSAVITLCNTQAPRMPATCQLQRLLLC